MNTSIFLSYLLIIGGVVIWGVLLPRSKKVSPHALQYISVFGGAFLFASCFINLVPHMYLSGYSTPTYHFKMGAAVLLGFLVQLLLEHLTLGVEHGHNHCQCCEETLEHHTHHHHEGHCHENHIHPIAGLIIGLCIHAFFEGMPLIDLDGDIHQGLLFGIVLHNIPIALVLVGLFISNHYSITKSMALLFLFAVMTPLGSVCNLLLLPADEVLQAIIMGIVVGILLHVSVSILFDHDHNQFSWFKLLLILLAFSAAYFTPGCPEIYPL